MYANKVPRCSRVVGGGTRGGLSFFFFLMPHLLLNFKFQKAEENLSLTCFKSSLDHFRINTKNAPQISPLARGLHP